jgi:Transglutaminase-like superfamily
MSVKGRKRRLESAAPAQSENPQRSRWYGWVYSFALGSIVASVILFAAARKAPTQNAGGIVQSVAKPSYPSLGQLAEMSDDELHGQDIALLNLRCAEGLRGSEKLDISQCLATLDKWAAWVKHETDRHLYKFRQNPKDFESSEPYFRMLMLITVVQQDFKVHYDPDRIRDVDFTNSQDLFIHGMIDNDNGGTCVSMPVLYTAVARRLGYPVFLASAKGHLFCRWHDKQNYLNCEATSQGLNTYKDEYYMTFPKPISEAEVMAGLYLKSLSTAEEFAVFLAARGNCLEDNGRKGEALVSYAQAVGRDPKSPDCFGMLANVMGYDRMPAKANNLAGTEQGERQVLIPSTIAQSATGEPVSYQDPSPASSLPVGQPPRPHNVFKPVVPNYGPNSLPLADPNDRP